MIKIGSLVRRTRHLDLTRLLSVDPTIGIVLKICSAGSGGTLVVNGLAWDYLILYNEKKVHVQASEVEEIITE